MTSQDTDRTTKGSLPAVPGPPGRAGRLARDRRRDGAKHWPALVLLAAGLALRILALLAYRPALFYIDTPRYLLGEAPGMDPLGYGGVLRAILAVGNFDLVAAVQHLVGIAMAVVIYVVLLRRGAGRWLAALAIAPVLLDAYQVQIEQVLMPDVWLEALIVAGLAILLWRPTAGWRRVIAAGFVLGASATVAQIGEALLLPAVDLPARARRAGGWRLADRDRQGGHAMRGLRSARPCLHDRQLPDRGQLLPVPHRGLVPVRPDGGRCRLRHPPASCGRTRHVPHAGTAGARA